MDSAVQQRVVSSKSLRERGNLVASAQGGTATRAVLTAVVISWELLAYLDRPLL